MSFLEDQLNKSLTARLIQPGGVGLMLASSYVCGKNTLQLENHYEESQSARAQDP